MEVDLDLLEKMEGKSMPKDEDLVDVVSGINKLVEKTKDDLKEKRKK